MYAPVRGVLPWVNRDEKTHYGLAGTHCIQKRNQAERECSPLSTALWVRDEQIELSHHDCMLELPGTE